MDEIRIVDLEVFANHGAFPEENVLGQKFLVSVTLHADLRAAGASDDLEDSIDYGAACHRVNEHLRSHTYKLIERAAETTADMLLEAYPGVARVEIEIKKPFAPIGLPLSYVSVKISREREAE